MPNIFRVIMVLGWMGIFPASGVQPWLEGKEWNALEEASSGGNVSEWDMYRVLDQCGEADVSRNQEKGEIIIQCPARQDGTASHCYVRAVLSYDRYELVRAEYADAQGKIMECVDDWLYGRMAYEYDEQGRLVSSSCLNGEGKPVMRRGKAGKFPLHASIRYFYDRDGQLAGIRYLDADGKMVSPDVSSFARVRIDWNEEKGTVCQSFFKTETVPGSLEGGVHQWFRRYDGKDRLVEEQFLDEQGKPVRGKGRESRRWTYDVQGNLLETAEIPADASMKATGSPVVRESGIRKLTPLKAGVPSMSFTLGNGPDAAVCTFYRGHETQPVLQAHFISPENESVTMVFDHGSDWFRIAPDALLCLDHSGRFNPRAFTVRSCPRELQVEDVTRLFSMPPSPMVNHHYWNVAPSGGGFLIRLVGNFGRPTLIFKSTRLDSPADLRAQSGALSSCAIPYQENLILNSYDVIRMLDEEKNKEKGK